MWKSSTVLALLGLIVLASPAAANGGVEDTAQPGPCEPAIAVAEQARGIPHHLLRAIAMVESGRYSESHSGHIAWPWTVMAEGKGRYLPSKEAAIREVRALQARGVENIDVGCMQVNLYYHGAAFGSLEEAFDPINNVAYATAFLMELRHKRNSWIRAVKEYHSMDRQRQTKYRAKVMASWDALKKGKLETAVLPGQPVGAAARYGTYIAKAWPPRSYRDQRAAQSAARARVMSAPTPTE